MEIIVSVTIGAIVLLLCAIILAEAWVIYGLLNRILMQAKVPILDLPQMKDEEKVEEPPRKPVMSFHVPS